MAATQKTLVKAMEVYRSFTRPIIFDSIYAVLKQFELENTAQIYFRGEAETVKLPGSNFGDTQDKALYTEGMFRNKIYVNATVNPSPFNSGYHNQRRMNTEALFNWDNSLRLGITPEFVGRQVNCEIMCHFTSRIEAQNFVNGINYIRDQMITDMVFSPEGHMPVNDGILELYNDVHKLLKKNMIRPTDEEWYTYFKEKSLREFRIIRNQAGNQPQMVYPLKLRDIVVQFEDPDIRLANKAEIFGQYEVGFTYTFFHNEFIGWNISYPLNVHQDQIPDKWIVQRREEFERSIPYHGAAAPEYFAGARFMDNMRLTQAPYYLVLPNHDNWEPPKQEAITPIIQARLSVDEQESGEQLLCNIFEIPNFEWNTQAKAYILRRHEKAFTIHETPFLFEVYSDDLRVKADQLRMDEVGNIYMTRPPTTFRTQHLMINIDYGVVDYSNEFWDDIRDDTVPDESSGRPLIPIIFPWWDWETIPGDWIDDAPNQLPIDARARWNNYEMMLSLIVKNVKTYGSE